ncbi:uncharacterized protein LOC142357376, partial [Convolutriloba macropyga]|uniref:uncharacterized protein LOC142357376 n=1 Tax=Convolutriloba macropyga TaxID=536237 RepID=UPI003F52240F
MGFTDFLQSCFTPSLKRARETSTPEVPFSSELDLATGPAKLPTEMGYKPLKFPKFEMQIESMQPPDNHTLDAAATHEARHNREPHSPEAPQSTPWNRPRWPMADARSQTTPFSSSVLPHSFLRQSIQPRHSLSLYSRPLALKHEAHSVGDRRVSPAEFEQEAEALIEEAELLARAAALRKRRTQTSLEEHFRRQQWQQREIRLSQGMSKEAAGEQELETYRKNIEDLRQWHGSDCNWTSSYSEKLGEVEDAKQKAAETAKSLDTVLSRARAIQHRSQLTLHAASTQQAELQERLDKLQLLRSRRDQKVEEEVPHDELESEPGTDEEEQEEEAQEHDETDGVLDLISSDEEEAESPPSEEDEEEEAEVDMVKDIYQYLSDVDTGVAPLVQGFPAVYAYAMHGESDGEVVARHPESQDELTRKDLRRLLPGEWLSDEVINMYMKLLQQRNKRLQQLNSCNNGNAGKQLPRCHFFSSFFYNKLFMDSGNYDYSAVRRWTGKAKLPRVFQDCSNILQCDKIFVPIHQPGHWCMAVIDIKNKCFNYYDSMGGGDRACLRNLARYIQDEAKDKLGQDLDVSDWPHCFPKSVPQQRNGHDCGMFAVKCADYESRGKAFTFSQADMEYFRKRTVYELMKMK